MRQYQLPDLRDYLSRWQEDLEHLRQNRLIPESQFIRFAKDRGILVSGVTTGDPSDFASRGWLTNDQDQSGALLFHPFRFYPLHIILRTCTSRIAPSAWLQPEVDKSNAIFDSTPNIERTRETAINCDRVIDLAMLLEPIYWPRITDQRSGSSELTESEFETLLRSYEGKALDLVRNLNPDVWRNVHELLRQDAARLDNNGELYMLLRLSTWSQRERLTGSVSGALWIRQIAEVIRRGFGAAQGVAWEEEYLAFGLWPESGRRVALGSTRPLDDELKATPYVTRWWGLTSGSLVRWYVEGHTEYYAIQYCFSNPATFGIELINLKGMIKEEKANVALTLEQLLVEDKAQRRFSIVSFDMDVSQNIKVVQGQITRNNIVGSVAGHKPDFEFANFNIEELIEVAAQIDEAQGASGDVLRNADWEGVTGARAFEDRYKQISLRRPRSLKGREWGEALTKYAVENPKRSDDGTDRPFWGEVHAALSARIAHYDFQKDHFRFDPDTLEQIDLRIKSK